jgi:drug/metabolite transporter (DMT)-like permease
LSGSHRPSHLGAIGIALLVTILWSSSWVLIRWGFDDEALEPITFAALRYGLAAVALVGWVMARPALRGHVFRLNRSLLVRLVMLGIVFYAVTQGAQFVAIDNQPAATTALVLSLTPLLVAGLAARSLAEIPSRRQVSGAALVAFGAFVYFAGDLGATGVGMLAAVVGLGANVVSSVLGRGVNRRAEVAPVVVTALSMAIGAAILVIVGIGLEGFPSVSARAWLIVAWLALINTALAFTWWNLSLRRLSAVESAGINNTMLIQIAALAWIFLSERPGRLEIAGIVLVSLGVFLTQAASATRRRPRPPAPAHDVGHGQPEGRGEVT